MLPAAEAQLQALLEGHRLEVQAQPREELLQPHRRRVHLDAAGVDAGDVEQLAEQALEGVDALVDAVHQRGDLGVADALAQGLGEQAHRVQRLAQVVAGGGEELGLGAVGGLGGAARCLGLGLLDAQLQRQRVGARLQRIACPSALPAVRAISTVMANIRVRMPASCQCPGWLVSVATRA
jgi:hypothetical protein